MRSFLLNLFLCLTFTVSAHIEPPKTIREKNETYQQQQKIKTSGLKSCRMFKVGIADGMPAQDETPVATWFYDSRGRDSVIHLFDAGGKMQSVVNQTYNNAGSLVIDADTDPRGRLQEMNMLTYSEDGLIRKVTSYDSTSFTITATMVYEEKAEMNSVMATKRNPDGSLVYTIQYRYAPDLVDGRNVETTQLDSEGSLMIRTENHFDAAGMRTEKRIFNKDKQLDFTYFYSYTPSGDFSEIRKVMADGSLSRVDTYSYNKQGFVSELQVKDGEGKWLAYRKYYYQ